MKIYVCPAGFSRKNATYPEFYSPPRPELERKQKNWAQWRI